MSKPYKNYPTEVLFGPMKEFQKRQEFLKFIEIRDRNKKISLKKNSLGLRHILDAYNELYPEDPVDVYEFYKQKYIGKLKALATKIETEQKVLANYEMKLNELKKIYNK